MQVHIRIYGQVQGVFFRQSAKLEAERLGIVGWVRNADDGAVEIAAQAEKAVIDRFVAWCKKGPPLAKVEKVEVDWADSEGNFNRFDIL